MGWVGGGGWCTCLSFDDGLFEPRADHSESSRSLTATPWLCSVRGLEVSLLFGFECVFVEAWDEAVEDWGLVGCGGVGGCGGWVGGLAVEAGEGAGDGAPRERGAEAGEHCGGRRGILWWGGGMGAG